MRACRTRCSSGTTPPCSSATPGSGSRTSCAPSEGRPQTGPVAGTGLRRAGSALADRVRAALRRLVRPGRPPGLRTAKTVLAAVVAYAVADALNTSSSPVLAPLTALLVVQLTMYETLAAGRERIVSVVAGVLLATLFAGFVGLTWWRIGLVVLVSIVAGRLLRLGPHLLEVPI